MGSLRASLRNFSGDQALWDRSVNLSSASLKPDRLTRSVLYSLKGNSRRAHLGPTGKRKTVGPHQKTLQRREALV